MKPYYEGYGVTLYHGDMREVDLPRARLVLTDPPYSERTHKNAKTWGRKDAEIYTGLLVNFDSVSTHDLRVMLSTVARTCDAWLIGTMDYRHIMEFEEEPPDGLRFVRFGIWRKPNGMPQISADRPAMGWEGIAIMHALDGRMQWNGGGFHACYGEDEYYGPDFWRYNKINHKYKIGSNPTAKPPSLWAQLMSLYSNPGDMVVDPFCGDGTTLAVAALLGRRAVGVELNEQHCHEFATWIERGGLEGWRDLVGRDIIRLPEPKSVQASLFDEV